MVCLPVQPDRLRLPRRACLNPFGVSVTAAIDALLASGSRDNEAPVLLALGTVTATATGKVTVVLDGADTGVTATRGTQPAAVNDRVIVTRLGRTLYVIANLTTN